MPSTVPRHRVRGAGGVNPPAVVTHKRDGASPPVRFGNAYELGAKVTVTDPQALDGARKTNPERNSSTTPSPPSRTPICCCT